MLTKLKFNLAPLLIVLTSSIIYALFTYDLVRTDYIKLITLYVSLFILFLQIIKIYKYEVNYQKIDIRCT